MVYTAGKVVRAPSGAEPQWRERGLNRGIEPRPLHIAPCG
jgi:hypothetical protein